jgi:hypothetical protein
LAVKKLKSENNWRFRVSKTVLYGTDFTLFLISKKGAFARRLTLEMTWGETAAKPVKGNQKTHFADAITAGDPRTKNLYFDVATLTAGQSKEGLQKDAMRMRQIGLKRILYGTDTSPPHPPARISWGNFKGLMPLTDTELRIIARNVAPYMRW